MHIQSKWGSWNKKQNCCSLCIFDLHRIAFVTEFHAYTFSRIIRQSLSRYASLQVECIEWRGDSCSLIVGQLHYQMREWMCQNCGAYHQPSWWEESLDYWTGWWGEFLVGTLCSSQEPWNRGKKPSASLPLNGVNGFGHQDHQSNAAKYKKKETKLEFKHNIWSHRVCTGPQTRKLNVTQLDYLYLRQYGTECDTVKLLTDLKQRIEQWIQKSKYLSNIEFLIRSEHYIDTRSAYGWWRWFFPCSNSNTL